MNFSTFRDPDNAYGFKINNCKINPVCGMRQASRLKF